MEKKFQFTELDFISYGVKQFYARMRDWDTDSFVSMKDFQVNPEYKPGSQANLLGFYLVRVEDEIAVFHVFPPFESIPKFKEVFIPIQDCEFWARVPNHCVKCKPKNGYSVEGLQVNGKDWPAYHEKMVELI